MTPKEQALANSHRAYMAFDRIAGSAEAACLVFASTAKEARKISYGVDWCESQWIDWSVKRLNDLPDHLWAMYEGYAGTISCPPVCPSCKHWGHALTDDGCEGCSESDEYRAAVAEFLESQA